MTDSIVALETCVKQLTKIKKASKKSMDSNLLRTLSNAREVIRAHKPKNGMPSPQAIDSAKALLEKSGRGVIFWSVDDVLHQAKQSKRKLSVRQAKEVLAIIIQRHEANIGINWEVIDTNIDMYLQDQ